MAEHLKFLEEAEKRNHLRIGKEQELFFFDEMSPGSPFLLPNGVKIFNQIQSLLRTEYRKRGYQEVQTPNMFDVNLWKVSNLKLNPSPLILPLLTLSRLPVTGNIIRMTCSPLPRIRTAANKATSLLPISKLFRSPPKSNSPLSP